MDSNQRTLQSYQKCFQKYINDDKSQAVLSSPGNFQGQWLRSIVDRLPKLAKILEIGSATGRDATFIQSLGYKVEATDAFDEAVDYLRQQGFAARKLNILTDEIADRYDLVLASAVFLHFTNDQLESVLAKLKSCLVPGGYLAFSLIRGQGDKWTDDRLNVPRYFNYWGEESINELLTDKGYKLIEVATGLEGKWLLFSAQLETSNV